jgi:hypothetical protein
LVVHGQGLQRRQVRGLLDEEGVAGVFELSVRKYECQACRAVMTVVPRGVLPGRQYTAPSIALALWLWVAAGVSAVAVRGRVCAWGSAGRGGVRGWMQLYRWVQGAASLFALPRPISIAGTARETALRVVMMVSALGLVASESVLSRVFSGASHAC